MHACLAEAAASWQGDLLNDLQRHHGMDFLHRVTFRLASPVRMIRGRVANVIEVFWRKQAPNARFDSKKNPTTEESEE